MVGRLATHRRLVAGGAGLAVVVMVAALLFIAGRLPAQGSDDRPELPGNTLSVPQALAKIQGGGLAPTDLLAVEGWLAPPEPRIQCPDASVPGRYLNCGSQKYFLGDRATNPAATLTARDVWGVVPEVVEGRGQVWVQAVLVGHVRDGGAERCTADTKRACEAVFVIDQVASMDEQALGATFATFRTHDAVAPTMSRSELTKAVAKATAPGTAIVSMMAMTSLDAGETYWPSFGAWGGGAGVVWYVRLIGPPPGALTVPGSRDGSGVLVFDDATGRVRSGAGWGADPRIP